MNTIKNFKDKSEEAVSAYENRKTVRVKCTATIEWYFDLELPSVMVGIGELRLSEFLNSNKKTIGAYLIKNKKGVYTTTGVQVEPNLTKFRQNKFAEVNNSDLNYDGPIKLSNIVTDLEK